MLKSANVFHETTEPVDGANRLCIFGLGMVIIIKLLQTSMGIGWAIDIDDKRWNLKSANVEVDQTAEPVEGAKRLRGLGLG
jgi:hypothetical protein